MATEPISSELPQPRGPRDARGVSIEVGDRAVYVTTGRYAVRAVVEVIDVKKKVKVAPLQQDRTFLGLDKEGIWVDGYSIFLVERFKGEEPSAV